MLVCVCNGISDKQIDSELANGASSVKEIQRNLGIGSCCGQCVTFAKHMIEQKVTHIQASQAFDLAYEIRS
ncbi:MAG: bacterioferritin-associated ferredoxin [Oleiphilus sp.]